MPVQATDIDQEIAYILQYWIQNNNRAITGTIGQNVVWNLAQFIKQNPENYQKATVVASSSNYTTNENQCLVIFTNNASGALNWIDNRWNKYYFVNATDNDRLFSNGKTYYDINGIAKTKLIARSSLYIAKGDDDFWYEITGGIGGSDGAVPNDVYIQVGVANQDVNNGVAVQPDDTSFVVNTFVGWKVRMLRNKALQNVEDLNDGDTWYDYTPITARFTPSTKVLEFETYICQAYKPA